MRHPQAGVLKHSPQAGVLTQLAHENSPLSFTSICIYNGALLLVTLFVAFKYGGVICACYVILMMMFLCAGPARGH
jgi:hypothetical protein